MDEHDQAVHGGSSAFATMEESTGGDASNVPSTMGNNRSWMYRERKGKLFSETWRQGLENFLDHAFSLPEATVDEKSHCPCNKCFCRHKRKRDEMTIHLWANGFQLGYEKWTSHGEPNIPENIEQDDFVRDADRMDDMLVDAIAAEGVFPGEEPTRAAQKFYKMLVEADTPLHAKTSQTRLCTVARLMTIKTQHNLSEACYNETMTLIHDVLGNAIGALKPMLELVTIIWKVAISMTRVKAHN